MKINSEIQYICKRDGRIVPFDSDKITDAIFKAVKAEGVTYRFARADKEKYPDIIVQIDGGVSLATAEELRDAGADRLIVGSALFGSDNVVDTLYQFQRI